jgi:hypothetical protein
VTVTIPRFRVLLLLLAALLLAVLPVSEAWARGGGPPGPPPGLVRSADHEVWMLDQGTDLIHVLDSRHDLDIERSVTIDVSVGGLESAGFEVPDGVTSVVPHMIEFDSRYRYAFVAATAGRSTIVIDARTKEAVAVLETGPASHMAAVTPDDSAVWVAVIGSADPSTQNLVEIPLDLDADEPTFEIGRIVNVREVLEPFAEQRGWRFPGYQPVCHQFTPDSREAWVTLGPGWNTGGLFVLDLDSAEVTAAWDPEVVRANCGVGVNREGTRVVANWSGKVVGPGQDTQGEWYVFNARNKRLLRTESARGFDAHGVRFTPDGRHLWAVNRISDNGLVIDARSFRVIDEIEHVGDTPDILDFSPDASRVYVTQRGPAPLSGGVHAAAGQTPGIAVLDAATREVLEVIEPVAVVSSDGVLLNDVHGVGVRPIDADQPLRHPGARGLQRRPSVVDFEVGDRDLSLACHVTAVQ